MLSRILRVFKRVKGESLSPQELPSDLRMSLSLIEAGCIAFEQTNTCTGLVFKDTKETVSSIKESKQIRVARVECIDREEFPSIRVIFLLKKRKKDPLFYFDCLFSVESEEEMKLLKNLQDQDNLCIVFMDNQTTHTRSFKISREDREKIKEALRGAKT